MSVPLITLNAGHTIPQVGFGTWQAKDEELEAALEAALSAGYRHIDTAAAYENEHVIGKVINRWIQAGKLKRSDLFIVTKLPPVGVRPAGVQKFLNASLEKLGTDYVDVYLVHTPFSFQDNGTLIPRDEEGNIMLDTSTDHLAIWKEMEKAYDEGKAKSIGISNFNIKQIQRLLDNCRIRPANLQVEMHVYHQQRELMEFCKKNGIAVTAYSTLGTRGLNNLYKAMGYNQEVPDLLNHPVVMAAAKTLGRTSGQILLKHAMQSGFIVIPKSTNDDRIKENFNLFDFELTKEVKDSLDALDMGPSGRILNFLLFKGVENHPEYPFKEDL